RSVPANAEVLTLPPNKTSIESYLQRQSHRQFLTQSISLDSFSDFLAVLSAQSTDEFPLPKYRYASAGSLYPIQTYIHVKANRITEVDAGWYYYHPTQHCLVKCLPNQAALPKQPSDSDLYGPNQQLHQDSAFSIFLIANMDAIEPIYGDKSRDFCLMETGYMGQLMMEKAPDFELGLCPIGGFDSKTLQKILGLTSHQQPLHALVGGAIAPSWSQKWMAVSNPSRASNTTANNTTSRLTDSLRQHLSNKLPSYMVPTRYQLLESLPLTSNGKVDRKALPTPTLTSATEYVAPTTPTEQTITELWDALLLDVDQVGIYDNFFEVGGNSLTAMQLLSQLQSAFSIELTITQLFSALTPVEQAQLIDQQRSVNSIKADSSAADSSTTDRSTESTQANGSSSEAIPR
ncbi:MAG: SagB family peptide dehydrogenase, partial [Cyanobacteria bacterium J06576_12]